MRDHKPIVQKEFGLFDRGTDEVCPITRNLKANNLIYTHFGAKVREGTVLGLTFPNLVRQHIYKRTGEADRLLLLNTSGEIHDSTNIGTPILTIPAMTDFSIVVMFNRAYISPHNGVTGLAGEKVYVYGGSGTARSTGASPPSGFNLDAHNGSSGGHVETGGERLVAVAFETDTGYITRPGPIGPAYGHYAATGTRKMDVLNIPIGPAGTVARHILVSRAQPNWNGDQVSPELFFVPNGKISNNTDVQLLGIDFYDADLVSSADYLFDNLDNLPAFLGMCDYGGKLCGWGENAKPSIVRVSAAGQPESVSSIEGFAIINPGDGLGLTRCVSHRGLLHCYKKQRHYMTQDNNLSAVTWKVVLIDSAIGTDVNGVSQVLDSAGQTMDQYLIASRKGLQRFAGAYDEQPLSFQVDDIWRRINNGATNKIQVVQDPVAQRVYISLPLDGSATINTLLMMDYQNGLSAESVRWACWSFANYVIKSIVVDTNFTDQSPVFTIGAASNTYKLSASALNDNGTAIPDPELEFCPYSKDDEGIINHFAGVRLRILGSGTLRITAYGLDRTISFGARDTVLSTLPGKEYSRLFDIKSEKCIVNLKMSNINEWFHINKFVLYYIPLWMSRGE